MTSAWRCWRSRRRPGPGLLEGPGLPGGGRVPGAAGSVWSPAGPPAGPGGGIEPYLSTDGALTLAKRSRL